MSNDSVKRPLISIRQPSISMVAGIEAVSRDALETTWDNIGIYPSETQEFNWVNSTNISDW